MELHDYLKIVKKYLRISLLAGILMAGLGLAANWYTSFVPLYSATATVLVGGDVATVEQNLDYRALADQFSTTYADLATRNPILQGVIDTLGLKTTTADLADYVNASVVEDTQLIEITASDNDPKLAAGMANVAADKLVAFSPRVVRNFVLVVEYGDVPSFPSLTFFLIPIISGVLGFLFVAGVGFLIEFNRNPIYSADELTRRTDLQVLATVRAMPKPRSIRQRLARRKLPAWRKTSETPWWPLVQVCRRRFTEADAPSNYAPDKPLVLITSPSSRKEKGVVASNLAATWAKTGARVVLIDADLSSPLLDKWFNLPRQPGLVNLLNLPLNPERLQEALYPTDIPGLVVIPAGMIENDGCDCLNVQSFNGVLNELSKLADAVVVDGPPMLNGGDGSMLASHAHGVLLALKTGQTSIKDVEDVQDALAMAGSNLWGAILLDSTVAK